MGGGWKKEPDVARVGRWAYLPTYQIYLPFFLLSTLRFRMDWPVLVLVLVVLGRLSSSSQSWDGEKDET